MSMAETNLINKRATRFGVFTTFDLLSVVLVHCGSPGASLGRDAIVPECGMIYHLCSNALSALIQRKTPMTTTMWAITWPILKGSTT
ncbi:hypothetical protein DM860_004508 [Cuscuta australis]|uniref:Uncharacterized protein n=1 Tax=Cuscuta australis TaxID=267555 RepID=A0A328E818_9ASTE|nr:hypothetical protein DM860_004508 [Cuscuta australis]